MGLDLRLLFGGFYPGAHPGEQITGTGATFDEAREGFEEAWRLFSAKRTEADYQAWRDADADCSRDKSDPRAAQRRDG